VVRYKLWDKTLALMTEFQSDCPDLWFVSDTGTPLVANRIENGSGHIKDLIGERWKKHACPIPLSKFRSIAANQCQHSFLYGHLQRTCHRRQSYFQPSKPRTGKFRCKLKHHSCIGLRTQDTVQNARRIARKLLD
jgi:hypothetical protein